MNQADFLPRRLSQEGCVVAGTQLDANGKKLHSDKVKLQPKVAAAVTAVHAATAAVAALETTDAAMVLVDRGADRCIAAFDRQLGDIAAGLDHENLLPLVGDEGARKADALLVRSNAFAQGTAFLKLPYRRQWSIMTALTATLAEKDIAAAVRRLGVQREVDRVGRWTSLYGAKLGITQAKDVDAAAVAVDAWHTAWGRLVVQVHAAYEDDADAGEEKIRQALLSPYDAQAAAERKADARPKRKPAPPVTATATAK